MSSWYSASDQARIIGAWSGAPIENEETLAFILDTAREQVEDYAPDDVPAVFDPVEVTWADGSVAHLTRDGAIVTGRIVPATPVVTSAHPIPEGFGPSGQTVQMSTGTGYTFTLDELDGLGGGVGMFLYPDGTPAAPSTFTWLADPADGNGVPSRFVYAQLLQAQRLWAAGRADENGDIGTEGYSFVPRPLDKTIRNIIRPVRGDIGGGF